MDIFNKLFWVLRSEGEGRYTFMAEYTDIHEASDKLEQLADEFPGCSFQILPL